MRFIRDLVEGFKNKIKNSSPTTTMLVSAKKNAV